jgi:hypothetical protein
MSILHVEEDLCQIRSFRCNISRMCMRISTMVRSSCLGLESAMADMVD